MHHHTLWTLLCNASTDREKIGANLQHLGFGPDAPMDRSIAEAFGVPAEWELRAQLVFGEAVGPPRENPKTFDQVEGKRMFVHGA